MAQVRSKPPRGVLQVDWAFFGELCRVLALKVFREYDPEVVIGIAKAGVIPGAVVASILQRDFASIAITAEGSVIAGPPRLVTGKRVLLVDETCESGNTMKLALAALRDLNNGCGWGIASFTSLDELPAMVSRAYELSRAVRLDDPIRLAETPPEVADAILELDGDVRGIALSDKKKLLDRYNGAMLAVS